MDLEAADLGEVLPALVAPERLLPGVSSADKASSVVQLYSCTFEQCGVSTHAQ